MRNRIQHASPFRWMLRRYIFLMVAVLLISFAVFPMQGMTRVMSVGRNLSMRDPGEPITSSIMDSYIRELTLDFVYSPLNLEMLCLLFGGLGFGAALVLFRHLFSRKQGMMIAGLPMTRSKDFLLRCMVYLLWCLLPLGLCLLIHPAVVWGNGLRAYFNLRMYLMRAGTTLLINLYGFALGALCASLFGTVWSAVLGGLLTAGSAELVMHGWIEIASMYLKTMFRDGTERAMFRFSPIYSMYKSFYRPDLFTPFLGLLVTAILLALGWAAYRRVKPENAGQTLSMKRLEPALLAWTAVMGGTAGAVVLSMYLGREIILYLGLLLGVLVAWMMTRMLLDQRIQLNLRRWKIPAAVTGVLLLALLCLRGDWFGYDAYAPELSDLSAIRLQGPNPQSEGNTFTGEESMEACLTWVGQMRKEALELRKKQPFTSFYGSAVLVFEEKSGRRVTRQYEYPEDQAAVLPALRVLAKEMSRQQAESLGSLPWANWYSSLSTYGIFGADFQEAFGFSLDHYGSSRIDAQQAREALRQDLQARTLDTLQQPCLFYLNFEGVNPETGDYEYDYNRENQIRPGDVHVLSLVLGEDAEKWVDYACGGFFRSGQVRVFLCEYSLDGEEEKLESFRMAETEEEVRDWMSRITRCTDLKFCLPKDRTHQVKIYSLPSLRDLAEYGESDLDLEDPEVLRRLPELTDAGAVSYAFVRTDI